MKFFITLISIFCISIANAEINAPQNLKTDYHTLPLGIDNPEPLFSWEVGDVNRGASQSAYRIIVSDSYQNISENKGNIWDSKKVNSDRSLQINYEGTALKSSTRYYWRVQTWNQSDEASGFSDIHWFETGLLSKNDWQGEWIYSGQEPPEEPEAFYDRIPAPLFRKSFTANKNITNARLYISGLGYYEAFINGEKVGDHWLDPGWTQYAETVYYAAYDVTHHVQNGENALGVMLGNGWYNPLPMQLFGRWNLRNILTIGQPKLIAQLHLDYEDGSSEIIISDQSWKVTDGPIVKNNVYLGEWYDARMEKEGWDEPDYNDQGWDPVAQAEAPAGDLKWQIIPPIKHTKTVTPVSIASPQDGMYVIDMGQNFAGVIRFEVNASAGTEVKFRYAELVYADGTLDFRTTAATQIKEGGINGGPGAPATAWQEDRYFCKGNGKEIFEPKFTFHGFRYVEITGLPYKPSLNDIQGIRLNADLQKISDFQCSEQLFNEVQEVTEWTMLSNVFSIESDCPAREKFGYGGDMVTAGEAYIYNYDMTSFYTKTVRDFERDALPSGAMTECAPNIGINSRGIKPGTGPVGWTLAHPFLIERLYKYYGDIRLVKEQYQPMKDLVDFYHKNVPDHIIRVGIGDHVSIDERPVPVTSTAFYYHHVKILADMAELLGKKEDASIYTDLAEEIKQAFIQEFVNEETGEVFTYTQAAQVFALFYDLLPEDVRAEAEEVLMKEIYQEYHGHLSTGIFATKMMLDYLSQIDRNDVAYDMMIQKEFPGYGYMLDNGATTLWENWSFKSNDSKNHPMFGSISEWFHESILGISQSDNSVAFKEITIKPAVVGGMTYANGYYHSVRGKIGSSWWKFGDDLFLKVEIPANTTAMVYIPKANKARADLYEQDQLLIQSGAHQKDLEHVKFVREERDFFLMEVGAGKYEFKVRP